MVNSIICVSIVLKKNGGRGGLEEGGHVLEGMGLDHLLSPEKETLRFELCKRWPNE